jgi:hypothetical protein
MNHHVNIFSVVANGRMNQIIQEFDDDLDDPSDDDLSSYLSSSDSDMSDITDSSQPEEVKKERHIIVKKNISNDEDSNESSDLDSDSDSDIEDEDNIDDDSDIVSISSDRIMRIINSVGANSNSNINIENEEESKNEDREEINDFEDEDEEDEEMINCDHYKNHCLIKASCCGNLFPCHNCHDKFVASKSKYESVLPHKINPKDIKIIVCRMCMHQQTPQQYCEVCGIKLSEYFCKKCAYYDKDKKQFHCDKCDTCYLGPKIDYKHCNSCNLCMKKSMYNNHTCIENRRDNGCPICLEDFNNLPNNMVILLCGHTIHNVCLDKLIKTINKCPLCSAEIKF